MICCQGNGGSDYPLMAGENQSQSSQIKTKLPKGRSEQNFKIN